MNQSSQSPLVQTLSDLARKRRSIAVRKSLWTALAAATAFVAASAIADTSLQWGTTTRSLLAIALALALAAFLIRRIRESRRHTLQESAAALEKLHPEIGQKLRTALEIDPSVFLTRHPHETVIARTLHGDATRTIDRLDCRPLLSKRALAAAFLTAAVLFSATFITTRLWPDFRLAVHRMLHPTDAATYTRIVFTQIPDEFDDTHPPRIEFKTQGRSAVPAMMQRKPDGTWKPTPLNRKTGGDTWDFVFTGNTSDIVFHVNAGDSETVTRTIFWRPVPKLIESKAGLSFPEYTGLKDESVNGGDVRCVEGTSAKWQFKFDTRPDKVTWSVAGGEPVTLSATDGGREFSVDGTIAVGKLKAELAIHRADGRTLDRWLFEIDGLADKLPTVEIVEPHNDLDLISTAEIPVRIRAKDDFGVSEIGLVLEAGGERRWLLEKTLKAPNGKDVTDLAKLMLEEIPLEITDNVRMYAYALDHKPRGGPRGVSPLRAINIKQFQMRWIDGGSAGGGGAGAGPDSESLSDALIKLDQLVSDQRSVVSGIFELKESYRGGLPVAEFPRVASHAGKETFLSEKALELAADWRNKNLRANDIALLESSGMQMAEAVPPLNSRRLAAGFEIADRALSSLLRLRKELVTLIMRGKGSNPSKSSDDPPPPTLQELAKEARRIAAEEEDIAGQVRGDAAAENAPAARRQQEVATSDTGELYSKLIDHPEKSDLILKAADDAEKSAIKADKRLQIDPPGGALPDLESANRDLVELAVLLESADLENAAQTLAERADAAEKSAESQQDAAGSQGGKSEAQKAADAARESKLTAEILKDLARRSAEEDKRQEQERSERTATLEGTEKQAQAGALANALEQLSRAGEQGKPADPKDAAEAAQRLQSMAGDLRRAAESLNASRAAQLNKLLEQSQQLKNDIAAGKQPGEGKAPGEKPGQQPGQGDGQGEKPGQGQGKQPGQQAGQGKGQGEQPGQQAGQGKGKGQGEQPGQGQGEGDGKQPGQGGQGLAENQNDHKGPNPSLQGNGGGLGGTMDRAGVGKFAGSLEQLNDDRLNQIAPPLRSFDFDPRSIPLLDAAGTRLEEMIAAIPLKSQTTTARARMPEEKRREIEDYFRDLSDDFGGETWEPKP